MIPKVNVCCHCKAAQEEWRLFLLGSVLFLLGLAVTGCSNSSSVSNSQTGAPAFSPGGGTYPSAQAVNISDTTSGAVLYCTTDGTTPTTSSPQCAQPTTVSNTEFLQAIAVAPGMAPSAVMSAGYTINLSAVDTPEFLPGGGNYDSSQNVTISDSVIGANIFYTIDGSTPTTASTPYTGPFAVSGSKTVVNAIAAISGYSNSAVATAAYFIAPPLAPPTFTPGSETLLTSTPVSISAASGATIYYTTDGSNPISSTTRTVYNGAITVSQVETINAIAVLDTQTSAMASAAYVFIGAGSVLSPTFTPGSSATVRADQDLITLRDADVNATIYYTYDGSDPSSSSTRNTYNGPFYLPYSLSQPPNPSPNLVEIQAIAVDSSLGAPIPSQVSNAVYSVTQPDYAPPAFAPVTGDIASSATWTIVNENQEVTLRDADPNATAIYYNIDTASSPTQQSSTLYSPGSPIIFSGTGIHILQAIAIDALDPNPPIVNSAVYIVGSAGTPFSGTVSSGGTPIAKANVQLYAAGLAGYGSGAQALGNSVTTDGNGVFSIGGNGNSYICPPAPLDEVYLVATGGTVGSNPSNSGIVLMTALGPCGSLTGAGAPVDVAANGVTINEVTTIASAYALAAFAAPPTAGGGVVIGAPGSPVTSTGAPTTCNTANKWLSTAKETCNYLGLEHAFGAVNNLVNFTEDTDIYNVGPGTARTITPAYAGAPVQYLNSSTVPKDRIHALADMLATCVDGITPCSTLFGYARPPAIGSSTRPVAPVDTLQAALDIARNPGNSVSDLLGLIPATNPPYSTAVGLSESAPPTDLTVALTFTGGGLGLDPTTSADSNSGNGTLSATFTTANSQQSYANIGPSVDTALAIDATGHIWVTGYAANLSNYGATAVSPLLAVFDNLGAPLTPPTTVSGAVATFGGYSPDPGSLSTLEAVAFDQGGNLLAGENYASSAVSRSLFELSLSGSTPSISSAAVAVGSDIGISVGFLAVDGAGNLWLGQQGGGGLLEVSPSGSDTTTYTPQGSGGLYSGADYGVFDSAGDLWITDGGSGQGFDFLMLNASTTPPYKTPAYDAATDGLGGFGTGILSSAVADGNGNVYACADPTGPIPGVVVDTFTSAGLSTANPPFTPPTQRGCGNQMALDGEGHIFAVTNTNCSLSGCGIAANVDEFSVTGNLISPAANGYTGTSSSEPATISPSYFTSSVPGISAAVDGSGNLWVLNSQTSGIDANYNYMPGNVLVEYVGIGAPVVTPSSVALTNNQLGARP